MSYRDCQCMLREQSVQYNALHTNHLLHIQSFDIWVRTADHIERENIHSKIECIAIIIINL